MADGVKSQPFSPQEQKKLAYARRGVVLAVLSGIIFSGDSMLIATTYGHAPFNDPALWLLVPLVCAGIHDCIAGMVITLTTWRSGRLAELWRSLVSRPGRRVLAGALFGAFFGMGGYMLALQMAGPAYVLPITTLYPAVAAVLAVFILKERISRRAWLGLSFCVIGAAAVGYTPPSGQPGDLFYWGLLFACIAAAGWGAEGVLATAGMDFIEPTIALNMYYLVSSVLYILVLVPVVCLTTLSDKGGLMLPLAFLQSQGAVFLVLAGILGAVSYKFWYMSMNMTGVSRAMALNISYALWGIVLSSLFMEVQITLTLIVGAMIIFFGMFLVIGNPKDMLNLRKVD